MCDCQRLLQIGHRCRMGAHGLVVLDAAPLSVHRDLCSIEASVQTGRNKTWLMSHGGFRCAVEQFDELALIRGLDGEDIDKCDDVLGP